MSGEQVIFALFPNKALEAKKAKENHRRKEEKDKKLSQAIHTWEHDILPHWQTK